MRRERAEFISRQALSCPVEEYFPPEALPSGLRNERCHAALFGGDIYAILRRVSLALFCVMDQNQIM